MELRSGGAVAVDPEQLRDLAVDVAGAAMRTGRVAHNLRDAGGLLTAVLQQPGGVFDIAATAVDLAAGGDDLVAGMRHAADVYEMVELRVRELVADGADAQSIRLRARLLERRTPGAGEDAQRLLDEWLAERGDEAIGQLVDGPGLLLQMFGATVPLLFARNGRAIAAGLLPSVLGGLAAGGGGVVASGQRLRGEAPDPEMHAEQPGERAGAPGSVADLISRIPAGGGGPTVRVERYELSDGTAEYGLFVSGTQGGAAGSVLDWGSNAGLYSGTETQAYRSIELALEAAGAHPGDVVHAAGHSQGAMIVSLLTAEGGYDVATLVTVGSPVQVDASDRTFAVNLRHDDDLVAALASDGLPYATGAEGSVVIGGSFDETARPSDVRNAAHGLSGYLDTAREFDESADPSATALRDRLAHLATVSRIEVFDYRPESVAERSSTREGGGF